MLKTKLCRTLVKLRDIKGRTTDLDKSKPPASVHNFYNETIPVPTNTCCYKWIKDQLSFEPVTRFPFWHLHHSLWRQDHGIYSKIKGYHTMRYEKSISGTGIRLKFPHKVKFHKDSCPRCRGVILSHGNSVYIMPIVHLQPIQPWMSYRVHYNGIEGDR